MKFIQIILLSFLFLSCNKIKTDNNTTVELDSLQKEELRITFINDSTQMHLVSDKYTSFWRPTWIQLDTIDSILVHSISEIKDRHLYYLKVDSLKNYYRQYVCYKDSVGDSIIFVNAMYHLNYLPQLGETINSKPKKQLWQKFIITVNDGGDSYWRIWINYSKKKQFRFIINGDA
jgi:hypothetical protein